jgi:hypothetical protein
MSKLVKKGQELLDAAAQGAEQVADDLRKRIGTEERPMSLDNFVDNVFEKIEKGDYPGALTAVGKQVKLLIANSDLGEKLNNFLTSAVTTFAEIAEHPRESAIKGLKDLSEKCNGFTNPIIKAIGTVSKCLASFIENPGKELKALANQMKEGLTTLYNASIGKVVGQAR